jgi:hypothetical protein
MEKLINYINSDLIQYYPNPDDINLSDFKSILHSELRDSEFELTRDEISKYVNRLLRNERISLDFIADYKLWIRFLRDAYYREYRRVKKYIQDLKQTIRPRKKDRLFNLKAIQETFLINSDKNELYQMYLQQHGENVPDEVVEPKPAESKLTAKPEPIIKHARELIKRRFIDTWLPDNNQLETQRTIAAYLQQHLPDSIQFLPALYKFYRDSIFAKRESIVGFAPAEKEDDSVPVLPYPFRSKVTKFLKMTPNIHIPIPDFTPDGKPLVRKKQFSRPSFAKYPHSWEIDLLLYTRTRPTYLVAININTRYAYLIPIKDKSGPELLRAVNVIQVREQQNFGNHLRYLRGDGEKGFSLIKDNFKIHIDSSPFTFHNKIVDALIRTLRNALGINSNHFWDGKHDSTIQQLVKYYNNTYHRIIGMTPREMHEDIEKEWQYIRRMTQQVNKVRLAQTEQGMRSYQPGDRIIAHLDLSKTSGAFEKRRRNFGHAGTFIEYVNGNVKMKLDKKIKTGDIVIVPIFFTKRLL